jgi:polyisoprenoid-binding protein YceI
LLYVAGSATDFKSSRGFYLRNILGLFGIGVLLISSTARADSWKIDPNHTAAQFSVRHMGISTVRGAFTKVSGTVDYDSNDMSKSLIDVTIDATSVDTRVEMRDNDLKSDHFFDVQKYPTITFKSTKVESIGPGKLKATGDLTIHGVTKQVVLNVEGITDPMKDPRGNLHVGASASTAIDRTQFGMTQMTGMVGTDITITIDAELTRPAAK